MVRNIVCLVLALGCTAWYNSDALAQQAPLPLLEIAQPQLSNPGSAGSRENGTLALIHQQHGYGVKGMGMGLDALRFSSGHGGNSRNPLGWSARLSSMRTFSLSRIDLGAGVAAQLLHQTHFTWGLGIYAGGISMSRDFENIPIFHLGDPMIVNSGTLALDAGVGTDFQGEWGPFRTDFGLYAHQLPRNAFSTSGASMLLSPQLTGYLRTQFAVSPQVSLGPTLFYRNTFGDGNLHLRDSLGTSIAALDLGLRMEVPRYHLWAMCGYRARGAGIVGGMGLQIAERDTHRHPDRAYLACDASFMAFVPTAGAANFSAVEIGISFSIGAKPQKVTVVSDLGTIWQSEANLTRHKNETIAPFSPFAIRTTLTADSNMVRIAFIAEDNALQYCGAKPVFSSNSQLERIGPEWEGVDAYLENIVAGTIRTCLSPDISTQANPDLVDSLEHLHSIIFSARLRGSDEDAQSGEGISYCGQLNPPGHKNDSLIIPIVYNERDYRIAISPNNQYVTNLELAAMKLTAMRLKFERELVRYYQMRGQRCIFLYEGETRTQVIGIDDQADNQPTQPAIYIRMGKLRIEPNHPKQEAFQHTQVELRFLRYEPGTRKAPSKKDEKRTENPGKKPGNLLDRTDFKAPPETLPNTNPGSPKGNPTDKALSK